jgi:hypothetical protein
VTEEGRRRGSWCWAWKERLRGVRFFLVVVEVVPFVRNGACGACV